MNNRNNKIKEEEQEVFTPEYSEKEKDYLLHINKRLKIAREGRDTEHIEFDEMDFFTWYSKNKKAANAYIPPKRNKGDVRIVTGTTQEKGITLLSALLNYNLEPNIESFDKQDMPIRELGENMEDMVKKSRVMEVYDDKRLLIYKELLDQGTCFVEEQWVEYIEVEKDFEKLKWSEKTKIKDVDWSVKLKTVEGKCEVNLLSGTKVYLGNVKEFNINKQPYLFTYDIIPYEEAKTLYRNWDRWENVSHKIVRSTNDEQETDENKDMVEVVKYQDKWNNEFMIMLNGVMMLPTEFPLKAISPSGEYTIVKGVAEPISKFFAYGKSTPAKSKADQEVLDEMLKLIILKTQKSFKPPLANRSNKLLSKDIFLPGTITSDVDPDLIQPIGDASGVTSSEFSTFELIKRIIDEKTVSPSFEGQQTSGSQTATEIMELKKQQMMKLGLLVFGVVSLEKQLCWLRIQNILANWTKPIDQEVDNVKKEITDIFKTISVATNLESGQKGEKIIKFDKEMSGQLTPEQIVVEEEFLSEPGKPVRVVYFNPELLKNIRATWYINITPTEKASGELDRMLLMQNIQDAAMVFGIQSLNLEYLKERFAILAKEDPAKFFLEGQPVMPSEEMQPTGGEMGAQIKQGAGIKMPSLNQVVDR